MPDEAIHSSRSALSCVSDLGGVYILPALCCYVRVYMVVPNLIVIMDFAFVNNKGEKCILLQLLVI